MEHKIEIHNNHRSQQPRSFQSREEFKAQKFEFLSAKIQEMIKKKNLNNSSFAVLMGVQPSIITRWLKGSHNFTLDTLFDIEYALKKSILLIDNGISNDILKIYVDSDSTAHFPLLKPNLLRKIDYENEEYKRSSVVTYTRLTGNLSVPNN